MKALASEVSQMGWKAPKRFNWWLLAYCLPIFICLLSYTSAWMLGFISIEVPWESIALKIGPGYFVFMAILFNATIVLMASALALGKEIGWRGFLVPQLIGSVRYPLLLSGFIWGIWHAPMILFCDYATSTQPLLSASIFIFMTTGFGVILGWLRLGSNSLWPAVLMHASHNVFFKAFSTDSPNNCHFRRIS